MQRCRVLIVDDQRDVRRMLRAALETLGAGISVTDVPSGEEAILVISRQPVDLLISDVRLPGISGLELIERTRIRNPELHLILITGMTDDTTRHQLDQAMADAYFFKPIGVIEFLEAVQELMGFRPEQPPAPVSAAPVEAAPLPVTAQSPQSAPALPPDDAPPKKTVPAEPSARLALPELPSQPILAEARRQLGAMLAALVNRLGETIDLSGEISAEIDEWVAVLRLTAGLVESGTEQGRTLIFMPGSRVDFCVVPVASGTALVVGAAHPAWSQSVFGELASILSDAAAQLDAAAGSGKLAPSVDLAAVDSPGAGEALHTLDELFANLQANSLKAVDVDAFWDLAAEDHTVPSEREGGMTYEEARRLGLAPDED